MAAVGSTARALRIRGELDVGALDRALTHFVQHHDALRTVFSEARAFGERVVLATVALTLLPVVDLSSVRPAYRETHLRERLQELAAQPFDLTVLPLARTRLFRLREQEHVLFWCAHHAIWDEPCDELLLAQLDAHYVRLTRGGSAERPSGLEPGGVPPAHRREGDASRSAPDGGTMPPTLPVDALDLPTDRPRTSAPSRRGASEQLAMSKLETDRLLALARSTDATLSMVMLAAYAVLLSRYSGQDDIVIGTRMGRRTRAGTEDLIGSFVNTWLMHVDLQGSPSFAALLGRVRAMVGAAEARSDPHVEGQRGRTRVEHEAPALRASYGYREVGSRSMRLGDAVCSPIHLSVTTVPSELSLRVEHSPVGMTLGVDYATDLFERETVCRFIAQYRQLLSMVCKDTSLPVHRVDILPLSELRALDAINATQVEYPRELGLHQLVERQCLHAPQRVAVVSGQGQLTYGQLASRAAQLAERLRGQRVRRGVLVGLHLTRDCELVVAMLAVLSVGACFVALDPSLPRERVASIAHDAAPSLFVTHSSLQHALPTGAAPVWLVDAPQTGAVRALAQHAAVEGDDIAYVTYDARATAPLRGVVVPHRAVVNLVASLADAPGLSSADVVLSLHPATLAQGALELWLPLVVGAKLVLAAAQDCAHGELLCALVRKHGVTMLQASPSIWRLLLAAGLRRGELALGLVGGEPLSQELARALVARVRTVWSMYGASETTAWTVGRRLTEPLDRLRIGRPLDNTQVYIVDAHGERCPLGVPGELLIGGDSVASGYLRHPQQTSERFLADRFTGGGRLFRTGERARLLPDGELDFALGAAEEMRVLATSETDAISSPVRQVALGAGEQRPGGDKGQRQTETMFGSILRRAQRTLRGR